MQFLVIMLICTASTVEYLTTDLSHAGWFKVIPEGFSVMIAAAVIFIGMRKGFAEVAAKYWVVFGALLVVILCGIATNSVGPGPTLAGMRFYLRPMPLFLLPAVFRFTDKQLAQQFKVILWIALAQIPVAAYQRYVIWSQGRFSGDDVRGTVMDSGVLSILLICCTLVLLGFLMQKRISRTRFFLLFFALLLPTTINETKATVVLLPLGILTTIVAGSPRGQRIKVFSLGVALLATFGAVMVPIYDLTQANNPYRNERHLLDFFTNQQEMSRYVQARDAGLGTNEQVRRGDAIMVPLQYLARDPVHLAFGLGFGNATHSNLGEAFTGDYYQLFEKFVITSFTVFLLEIGILGTTLAFVLYWMIFSDAIAVARLDSQMKGSLAIGWIGVTAIMTVSTFYTTIHTYSCLTYLFWYFAGTIAARRMQLQLAAQKERSAARSMKAMQALPGPLV